MTQAQARWAGRLQIGDGWAAYVGRAGDSAFHSHHAIQLCVGMDSPVMLDLPDAPTRSCRALIIAPDVAHRLAPSRAQLALLYVDPEAAIGIALMAVAGDRRIFEPRPAQASALRTFFDWGPASREVELAVRKVVDVIVERPVLAAPPGALDHRVKRVTDWVNAAEDLSVSAESLAELAGLSVGRLTHLFKEQIGIPIRPYLLWLKLRRAVEAMAETDTLTEAAHVAGFSDSAHMTRTFRRMFGVRPSDLVQAATVSHAPDDA